MIKPIYKQVLLSTFYRWGNWDLWGGGLVLNHYINFLLLQNKFYKLVALKQHTHIPWKFHGRNLGTAWLRLLFGVSHGCNQNVRRATFLSGCSTREKSTRQPFFQVVGQVSLQLRGWGPDFLLAINWRLFSSWRLPVVIGHMTFSISSSLGCFFTARGRISHSSLLRWSGA